MPVKRGKSAAFRPPPCRPPGGEWSGGAEKAGMRKKSLGADRTAAPPKPRRQVEASAGPTAAPGRDAPGRATLIPTVISAVLVIAVSALGWIGYQATQPHPAPVAAPRGLPAPPVPAHGVDAP